jgi:hypothetical protein
MPTMCLQLPALQRSHCWTLTTGQSFNCGQYRWHVKVIAAPPAIRHACKGSEIKTIATGAGIGGIGASARRAHVDTST